MRGWCSEVRQKVRAEWNNVYLMQFMESRKGEDGFIHQRVNVKA